LASVAAVAFLLGTLGVCSAQDSAKSIVTVAFSGYDELKANLTLLGNLAGQPGVADGAEGLLKMMTQGQGVAGLDTSKPWGAVFQAQGPQTAFFAFLPVSDLKKLLDTLSKQSLEAKDVGDGVFEIATPAQPVFVKGKAGWAVISINRETLNNTPADPSVLLGDLPKAYDLAVRVSLKNLPDALRQMITAWMQIAMQAATQRGPDESEDEYAMHVKLAKQSIQQVTTAINELDELTLGWKINRPTSTTYLDFDVTAQPGTKMAEQFAQAAQAKTNFAGFNLPGAAVTANWAGTIDDSKVAQFNSALSDLRAKAGDNLKQQGLSEEQLKLATQLLGELIDVLQKTLENKKVDGGLALLLKPNAATLVAGGVVVDGAKLEQVFKQLVAAIIKDEPQFAQAVKLDAEVHQGIHFHVVSLPVQDPNAAKFLGDIAVVVVGISDQSVYVAVGRDAAQTLKQVIDHSKAEAGKQITPFRMVVAGTPIAEFVAAVAPDEKAKQIASQIAATLKLSTAGADHLTITATPIPNGQKTRIELEQDMLKSLLMLAPQAGMGPGGPPQR
jgi:hypothetical protein